MLKRNFFSLSVCLALLLFCFSLLSSRSYSVTQTKSKVASEIVVDVMPSHFQQIPESVSALGTLIAVRSTGLNFVTGGHLQQKYFKDGDVVKKGDVVARLQDTAIASQLASAKANLDEAQSNYNRYELLKDSGVFSKQDYISVTTTLKVAKAKYADVLEQEQQLSLVVPFSGTLSKYNFSVGSQVAAGAVIVNLVQLDPMKVSYSLNQSEKGKVKIGQKVIVESDAWPSQKFSAKVSYISPTINSASGRFDLNATLRNPEDKLSPGGLVHIEHFLGKGHRALVVPQIAVNVDEDRSYVYTINNGKARQVNVSVGELTDNGNIIIKSGLKNGDQVVVKGSQKLTEGTLVKIIHATAKHPAPSDSTHKPAQLNNEKLLDKSSSQISSTKNTSMSVPTSKSAPPQVEIKKVETVKSKIIKTTPAQKGQPHSPQVKSSSKTQKNILDNKKSSQSDKAKMPEPAISTGAASGNKALQDGHQGSASVNTRSQ